jgi:hypothetical protein
MCVKIIKTEKISSFNPSIPLEFQLEGAKEVLVNYEPHDYQIQEFMDQVERIVKSGINCPIDIRVNTNNTLNGMRLERVLTKISKELHINEAIHSLVKMQAYADAKLCELSGICLGKTNER